MKSGKRKLVRTVTLGLLLCGSLSLARAQSDPVLYSLLKKPLFDGKFGKLAQVQAAIGAALTRCGKPTIAADGVFGNSTVNGLKALVTCP